MPWTEVRDENTNLGGTMRLGAYDAVLKKGSKVHSIYQKNVISERHRHRWEVNIKYKDALENSGVINNLIVSDNLSSFDTQTITNNSINPGLFMNLITPFLSILSFQFDFQLQFQNIPRMQK